MLRPNRTKRHVRLRGRKAVRSMQWQGRGLQSCFGVVGHWLPDGGAGRAVAADPDLYLVPQRYCVTTLVAIGW